MLCREVYGVAEAAKRRATGFLFYRVAETAKR